MSEKIALTTLKRFGKNSYTGLLTAVATPNWTTETLLMRFVEPNGCSTAFTITKTALPCFSGLEVSRIYDIEVPGLCVKTCSSQNKTGVRNPFEVRATFPMKCALRSAAWPVSTQYDFVPWEDLNQKANDTFVDLDGRVLSPSVVDPNSIIPKMKVEIGFKDFRQTVIMLGKHSEAILKEGDILVIGGIRIKEWQRERTLESTFLTIVEMNPSQRPGLEILQHIGDL